MPRRPVRLVLFLLCTNQQYLLSNDDLWRLKLNRLLGGAVRTNDSKLSYRELAKKRTNDYKLVWAAKNGHRDVVRLLLDKGADLHTLNDKPLRMAAMNGHNGLIRLLLDKGPIYMQETSTLYDWLR